MLLYVLLVSMLGACAPNRPAPVVSLEQHEHRQAQAKRQKTPSKTRPARYRIKKGDTLYSIAWQYGLDYKRLAEWNRIPAPYSIYVGRTLVLDSPRRARSGIASAKTLVKQPTASQAKKPVVKENSKPKPKSKAKPKVKAKPKPKAKPLKQKKPTTVEKPAARKVKPVKIKVPKEQKTALQRKKTGILEWMWPTKGAVTQTFRKNDRTRQGIRISGRLGQGIIAAEGGKVVYTGSGLPGYGKLIIIKHNKNYLSAYGFNRKLLVRDGEQVARGERVAEMGSSADGKAILHFEIRRRDRPLNPLSLLPR